MKNDPTPAILRRLERHAKRSGMTEHKVGVAICGSGTLFKRLRGGNVTIRTLRSVSGWLDAAEAPASDAQHNRALAR